MATPRLPVPGQDNGTWGDLLNDFLRQAHDDDGSLKPLTQSQITGLVQDLADKVAQADFDALQTTVAGKADASDVTALQTTVAGKADASDVTALQSTVSTKADSSTVSTLQTTVSGKADAANVYDKTTADGRYVQSVMVGSTTTGTNVAAGGAASVTNSGTTSAPVLNFTLPKGDPGDLTPTNISNLNGLGTIGVTSTSVATTKVFNLTVNGNVVLQSSPSSTVSGTFTLVLIQATGSGPFTVTWPATGIKWTNSAGAPTMPQAAGVALIVNLFWSGAQWYGMVAGTF